MILFVDGSAHPNPGPGGFGIVGLDEVTNRVLFCHQEQFQQTTNNEMELAACLYALAQFGEMSSHWGQPQIVYSDSSYAINTLTNWKNTWKRNGWKRSKNQKIENLILIQKYDKIEEKGYKIDLRKVEGHSNVLGNTIADLLATGKISENEVLQKYG